MKMGWLHPRSNTTIVSLSQIISEHGKNEQNKPDIVNLEFAFSSQTDVS